MAPRVKPPLELAARALCRLRGVPEDTRYNGMPMWHIAVHEAMVVMEAVLPKDELQRMIPGYPFPDLHDPRRGAD